MGNACDADDDNDGWTDVAESFITTDPLVACLSNGWAPDINSDGTVAVDDIFFAASRFGLTGSDAAYSHRPEIASQDGVIAVDDIFAFTSRFGQSCTP